MSTEPSPWLALLVGSIAGLLVCGPLKRWMVGLVGAIRDLRTRPDARAGRRLKLLLIYLTGHPAPWILMIGLPYAAYRLWVDPLRFTWFCVLAGVAVGCGVVLFYGARPGTPGTGGAGHLPGGSDAAR